MTGTVFNPTPTRNVNTKNHLDSASQLHRSGKLDAAAKIYRRSYESDHSDADACYGLGTVLMQQQKTAEAAEFLGKAVQLEPDVAEFHFNYASVLQQFGRTQEAVNSFLRAAELAARNREFLPSVCRKLIDIGLPDAALHFLSALANPDASALTVRARAMSAKQDFGNAALALQEAVKLEPKNLALWRELASANGRQRDFEAAIDAYKKYMELKTPDAKDLLAHADLLLLARQPKAAQEALDLAMAAGADVSAVHLLAARCTRLAGDYDATSKHLEKAIARRSAFGDAWQLKLELAEDESLPQIAADCVRLAADQKNPARDRIQLSFTAGRAFEKSKQYPQAFEQFCVGNELQRADQAEKGVHYEKIERENFSNREQSLFDVAFGGGTSVDREQQPIFILGMPRSGTTLVERILGGLDGVITGGESESVQVIANQYHWDLKHKRIAPPRDLKDKDWNLLADEYWRRATMSPCRLTDKMPQNFWHIGFICAMFPTAPVIYMRRDPRDISLSIFSRVFADGHPYATDMQELAHYFGVSMQIMKHWTTLYPQRVLEFSYEDLVASPEQQTKVLAKHCGLEWRAECLDFHKRVEASYTPSELQVREPINSKGVGAWRRYEDELGPLLEALERYDVLPAGQK